MLASELGIAYKGIRSPQEFWDHLASFPKASVSRVWYFGHASKDGLMLELSHDLSCLPLAHQSNMLLLGDLAKQARLADRFIPNGRQASRFYGCYTNRFAEKWHEVFKMPTEGAKSMIDFVVVNRPSSIPSTLKRIEQTPTSQVDPRWTKH